MSTRLKRIISPNVRGAVWRIFFIALVSLTVFLGVLYWNFSHLKTLDAEVERTHQIETELRDLGRDVGDAEASQRGFLITLSPQFLERYELATKSALLVLDKLDVQIKNPEVQMQLPQLRTLVMAKTHEMQSALDLAQHEQIQAARDLVGMQGKRMMEDFRTLKLHILDQEHKLLIQRRANNLEQIQQTTTYAAWGAGILIFLLFLVSRVTASRLGDPIKEVLDGVDKIAEGDLEHRIPIRGHDEISRIAEAVNVLSQRLLVAHAESASHQADLERSNAELDRFAYVASHDLKAPLRGLRSLAEWIKEDVEATATPDTLENLGLMLGRVDRLDGLLNSLLEYSRINHDGRTAQDIDSRELVNDIRTYLAPPAGFCIECAGIMPILFTQQAPLQQVLHNLISNALKHHDRDTGHITVTCTPHGNMVEFRVSDDGAGIAPQFHDKIFQMFQTLKPRDQVEGSGMGLAIVRKTVENFGGHIRVESSPPQRGTTFVFAWPKDSTTAAKNKVEA
jgi:signal transduction histidine kinase